jgi:predicted transcriptional regulator
VSTNLPPELNRLIAQELALGHYRTEEELLTEAVGLLTQRNALREQIDAGTRQLASGEYTDYDPQALRKRLDDLKFSEQEVIAIQEGIDDMEAGRGRPFREFDREFRQRNGLPTSS